MKIGSVVYATDQGLGVLARDFYRNGIITDVMVVMHGRHPTHLGWYPGATIISDLRRQKEEMKQWCQQMDAMLFFETPFDWDLIPHCRSIGVKTILMPMFECMPRDLPYVPDAYLNPSLLDQRYYPQGTFLPVPVEYPWKQRHEAKVFIHNAGHGGLKGRNGTAELVQAMRYTKSPAKLLIRTQEPQRFPPYSELLGKAELKVGTVPYDQLFSEGDVFVFPEKFNGLSLPLQEARAAGMLVMATDRFPMNTWLPREALIPTAGSLRSCVSPRCNMFDEAMLLPEDIAKTIDSWYGKDITAYSLAGKAWAEGMSWDALKPKYQAFIQSVVAK